MAMFNFFVCDFCNHEIEVWDEGDPYYFDRYGKKQYAPHPHPMFEMIKGFDSLYLCLECGEEVTVDSEEPTSVCSACHAETLVQASQLCGKPCPACKRGHFRLDPSRYAIS